MKLRIADGPGGAKAVPTPNRQQRIGQPFVSGTHPPRRGAAPRPNAGCVVPLGCGSGERELGTERKPNNIGAQRPWPAKKANIVSRSAIAD